MEPTEQATWRVTVWGVLHLFGEDHLASGHADCRRYHPLTLATSDITKTNAFWLHSVIF